MLAGRKYKSMWKLLASTQFESPFEITKEVKKFVDEYKLAKDFDKKKIDGDEEGKLKQNVAQELLRTSTLFIHENKYKEERLQSVKDGVRAEVMGLFKAKNPGIKVMPEIEVDISHDSVSDQEFWDVKLVMSLGNSDVEKDLESLRYSANPAENISDAAESYDWCAWLGIPESPFFDDAFVDEYAEDQASQAIEQFWHTRSETEYAKEVGAAIKELVDGYEPEYKYMIDLNERGSFRAHVEDPDGNSVFTFSNEEKDEETGQISEGPLWLVEDGFMKNISDLAGLKEYCVEHDFMPEKSKLVKGN